MLSGMAFSLASACSSCCCALPAIALPLVAILANAPPSTLPLKKCDKAGSINKNEFEAYEVGGVGRPLINGIGIVLINFLLFRAPHISSDLMAKEVSPVQALHGPNIPDVRMVWH